MQTAHKRTSRQSMPAYPFGSRGENQFRYSKSQKNTSPKRQGNDFLRVCFHPIYPENLCYQRTDEYMSFDGNLLTEENYCYLLECATNYAHLLKKELIHTSGANVGESIANLYRELSELTGQNMNIENSDERLQFVLYMTDKWDFGESYWIPLKNVIEFKGRLKKIVLSFLHKLIHAQGIGTILNSKLFENLEQDLYNWSGSFDSDKDEQDVYTLLDSYTCGDINEHFQRLYNTSYYKDLPMAIKRYAPVNMHEQHLLDIIREGIEFIGNHSSRIIDYAYNPSYCNQPDWYQLKLDELFMVIFENWDITGSEMDSYLHTYTDECDPIVPCTTFILSPETQKIHKEPDPFIRKFVDWIGRFCKAINEYHE